MSRGRAEAFQHMRKMIANVQANEELAASAAAVGLDAELIQRGQSLLEQTEQQEQQYQDLISQLTITAATLKSTRSALQKLYNHQRRLARLEITSSSVRTRLKLDDKLDKANAPHLEQCRRFYATALAHTDLQAALDDVGISRAKLETGHGLVLSVDQLITSEINLRAIKEQATADLADQIGQMRTWIRAATTLARLGATEHPQLLKAISHTVRRGKRGEEEKEEEPAASG